MRLSVKFKELTTMADLLEKRGIKIDVERLSMLLNHSNISVLRKRLYLKMSGKTGKASDFDLYINDL